MERSEAINELAVALAMAQGEIEGAAKTSQNPYFRSRYADLASVWEAIRGPLSKNVLAIAQPVAIEGSVVTVTTLLMHASGQWISSDLTMIAQRQIKDGGGWEQLNSPQAIGSVITYARRYALAAMVGVAPEDDDAEAAEGRAGRQQASQKRPPPEKSQTSEGEVDTTPELLRIWFAAIAKDAKAVKPAYHDLLNRMITKAGKAGEDAYNAIMETYKSRMGEGPVTVAIVKEALTALWQAYERLPEATEESTTHDGPY